MLSPFICCLDILWHTTRHDVAETDEILRVHRLLAHLSCSYIIKRNRLEGTFTCNKIGHIGSQYVVNATEEGASVFIEQIEKETHDFAR